MADRVQRRRGNDECRIANVGSRTIGIRPAEIPQCPIEYLSTEEVWAYLLQRPNPWGNDNRALYKLYANASNGECPIQIDTSTPSCGHSRFGSHALTIPSSTSTQGRN